VGRTIVEPLFQDFNEEIEETHENMYNLGPSHYKTGQDYCRATIPGLQ